MSVYISNSLYLADIEKSKLRRNRPLIGYHSNLTQESIAPRVLGGSVFSGAIRVRNRNSAWNPSTFDRIIFEVETLSEETTQYGWNADWAVLFTAPEGSEMDYLGLGAHTLSEHNCSIRIEAGDEPDPIFNPSEAIIPKMSLKNNAPKLFHFNKTTKRFWVIYISASGNEPGIHQLTLGHIKLGNVLRLERPMYVGLKPWGMGMKQEGISMEGDTGQYLGQQIHKRWRTWQIIQPNNNPKFVRENVVPFLDHLNGTGNGSGNGPKGTFFGAWRPDTYPDEVIYGWKDPEDDFYPTNQSSNGMMNWSANGRGHYE